MRCVRASWTWHFRWLLRPSWGKLRKSMRRHSVRRVTRLKFNSVSVVSLEISGNSLFRCQWDIFRLRIRNLITEGAIECGGRKCLMFWNGHFAITSRSFVFRMKVSYAVVNLPIYLKREASQYVRMFVCLLVLITRKLRALRWEFLLKDCFQP